MLLSNSEGKKLKNSESSTKCFSREVSASFCLIPHPAPPDPPWPWSWMQRGLSVLGSPRLTGLVAMAITVMPHPGSSRWLAPPGGAPQMQLPEGPQLAPHFIPHGGRGEFFSSGDTEQTQNKDEQTPFLGVGPRWTRWTGRHGRPQCSGDGLLRLAAWI